MKTVKTKYYLMNDDDEFYVHWGNSLKDRNPAKVYSTDIEDVLQVYNEQPSKQLIDSTNIFLRSAGEKLITKIGKFKVTYNRITSIRKSKLK